MEFIFKEIVIFVDIFLPNNYKFAIKLIEKGLNLLKYVGNTVSSLAFRSLTHKKYYMELTEKE